MKRIMAWILVAVLALSAAPFQAQAATEKTESQLISQIRRVYSKTLAYSEKENLRGYCGLMTGMQLYYMGVTRYALPYDGKDQYDLYAAMDKTSAGYYCRAYSSERYTLLEALNRITERGTKNVYNIVVGFEATNTEAGSKYGHAVVIHGIVDGYVYFVEGFYTSLAGPEGTPIKCTIPQFAAFYGDWTTYEGLVVFGEKDYRDECDFYDADLYVQVGQEATMLATLPGGPYDEPVRQAKPGERLYATGLFCNTLKQYYYRIEDTEETVYVRAEDVTPLWFSRDKIDFQNGNLPEALKEGEMFRPAGRISSQVLAVEEAAVRVLDSAGTVCREAGAKAEGNGLSLSDREVAKTLATDTLAAGGYLYQVTATVRCAYYAEGQLQEHLEQVELVQWPFTVGETVAEAAWIAAPEAVADGWQLLEGSWYFFQKGEAKTGWVTDGQTRSYLDENGVAVTDWVRLEGKRYFFTETGCMRTGWVETDRGRTYLTENGSAAVGKVATPEGTFYFGADGTPQKNLWVTQGTDRYFFREDGTMVTGWVTLPQGRFCFREDGRLFGHTGRLPTETAE